MEKLLLVVNCIMLAIGVCGGPLIARLYFIHGGKRVWLSSWLQTGGWPIILIPLTAAYIHRRKTEGSTTKLIFINPLLVIAFAIIGCFVGLDNYFYAYGVSKLPVSTSSLLVAGQLAFTAVFAFLLVKQKFTAYSINAVVLLTVGSAVLALHTSNDRPEGVSKKGYALGFVMTLAASALYGLILPSIELIYKKAKQTITYTLVMEIQVVLSFFATVFCTLGMVVNNDFKVISREAREFELGEVEYYVILVSTAIMWQCFLMGAVGVIFCVSSMLTGVIIAVCLPVTEILAVIFFHEKIQAEKGISIVLSLWGFVSYFYGEIKHHKKKKQIPDVESHQNPSESEMTVVIPP